MGLDLHPVQGGRRPHALPELPRVSDPWMRSGFLAPAPGGQWRPHREMHAGRGPRIPRAWGTQPGLQGEPWALWSPRLAEGTCPVSPTHYHLQFPPRDKVPAPHPLPPPRPVWAGAGQQRQQRPRASRDLLCPPQCRGDLTKTYSLEAYDNWFNCLSMLVATEVCRVRTAQQPRAGGRLLPTPQGCPRHAQVLLPPRR